ncbi:general secretion pathway protein H [Variovorax ginsengisoli]|uniref:General secretion pathway protein H n=1 Tax=Variovorax ginsengisoli TaxID=363844 RepID=A0ABT9S8Q1_9BURK|nr:general secretion pathway protein H [Variovorax ginsengisoli]
MRRRAAGFTLLELLVVIAIIAIATAGVGFALRDSGQASLEREGERLAALLESARARSRASGMVVRWRPTPQGPGDFTFDGLPPGALPAQWLTSGIGAQLRGAGGEAVAALQLGPDPIIAAQQVVLSLPGPQPQTVRIATDGLRPFAIVSP